jgi:hypothetical protein
MDSNTPPPIAAPISLPKGGGAIHGVGEKFDVDLATGTGSMVYPIPITQCRDAHPTISLSYNSAKGNSVFGLGWDIDLPVITRKTDKGLPRYDDLDVFISSGEDLVPMNLDEQGNIIPDETRGDFLLRRYAPRIEGQFNLIERWTHVSDQTQVHWKVTTPTNTTSVFGKDKSSRIQDPTGQRIFSWLLCQTYDSKGNTIVYEYKAENTVGVVTTALHEQNRANRINLYLKRIKYGNRECRRDKDNWIRSTTLRTSWMFSVVFDYGEHDLDIPTAVEDTPEWVCRPDSFSKYRAGFEIRTYRLCQRILMFHHFPDELGLKDCLVSSTDLKYDLNPFATYLVAITHVGYLYQNNRYSKKSVPPLELTYSQFPTNEQLRSIQPQQFDLSSLQNIPQGVDGSLYQWLDLDGEGLSGVFTEQVEGWFYKRNNGIVLVYKN